MPIPDAIGQKIGPLARRALIGRMSEPNSQKRYSISQMPVANGASRRRQNFQNVVAQMKSKVSTQCNVNHHQINEVSLVVDDQIQEGWLLSRAVSGGCNDILGPVALLNDFGQRRCETLTRSDALEFHSGELGSVEVTYQQEMSEVDSGARVDDIEKKRIGYAQRDLRPQCTVKRCRSGIGEDNRDWQGRIGRFSDRRLIVGFVFWMLTARPKIFCTTDGEEKGNDPQIISLLFLKRLLTRDAVEVFIAASESWMTFFAASGPGAESSRKSFSEESSLSTFVRSFRKKFQFRVEYPNWGRAFTLDSLIQCGVPPNTLSDCGVQLLLRYGSGSFTIDLTDDFQQTQEECSQRGRYSSVIALVSDAKPEDEQVVISCYVVHVRLSEEERFDTSILYTFWKTNWDRLLTPQTVIILFAEQYHPTICSTNVRNWGNNHLHNLTNKRSFQGYTQKTNIYCTIAMLRPGRREDRKKLLPLLRPHSCFMQQETTWLIRALLLRHHRLSHLKTTNHIASSVYRLQLAKDSVFCYHAAMLDSAMNAFKPIVKRQLGHGMRFCTGSYAVLYVAVQFIRYFACPRFRVNNSVIFQTF
ncbi:hypothetical protein CLF_111402 [Clonorchis sinensis]|uniref:Uncharacterized protein n=1 Tax=Clonorchis sinensis TaxID=79923 RepID=G7YUT3_CLOSI|nr:hypothetical protein CLF_111402 [Clonorchis sinensis]